MTDSDGNEIAELLAPFWTKRRTSEALLLTCDEVMRRVEEGVVLGLPTEPVRMFFPVWQFHRLRDGTVEVKPGIAVLISAFHRLLQPWTIGIVLRTPASELGGLTPEQWVRARGDVVTLTRYARRVTARFKR